MGVTPPQKKANKIPDGDPVSVTTLSDCQATSVPLPVLPTLEPVAVNTPESAPETTPPPIKTPNKKSVTGNHQTRPPVQEPLVDTEKSWRSVDSKDKVKIEQYAQNDPRMSYFL